MRLTILFIMLFICNLMIAQDNLSSAKVIRYNSIPDTILHVSEIQEIVFQSGQFNVYGNLYLPVAGDLKYPLVIWVAGSGASYKVVNNSETKKLINCFLDNGMAYFRIDKPGYGDTKGKLNDDSLFIQLSDIVINAINSLIKLPNIDSTKIGLFGSSQAGYIMPISAKRTEKISFIIGSSLPGENSIDQWNYLIEKQMICEGYTEKIAKKNIEMFGLLRCSENKTDFDKALKYFRTNPMIIKSVGYDSTLVDRAINWWPRTIDSTHQSYFNPISVVEKLSIPIFLIFGDKDTQIDPFQAIDAYTAAFSRSGNKKSKIILLKNTDHNMSINESGCLSEIGRLQKERKYNFNKDYLTTINTWIKILKEK